MRNILTHSRASPDKAVALAPPRLLVINNFRRCYLHGAQEVINAVLNVLFLAMPVKATDLKGNPELVDQP